MLIGIEGICARASLSVVVAALVLAGSAQASRLEVIDLPSAGAVDPATANFNDGGELKATVLLPDGYAPRRKYPLLLLLHGAGDTYKSWADPARGDIVKTAAGLRAIVVMPDAATGFYTNWFNGGQFGVPAWEDYFLDEVLPAIRARYRIRPQRRYHAVAGLSMGGLGATFLGGRLPGYFGSVSPFSGFVDHQRPEVYGGGLQAVSGVDYQTIFGPPDGDYATGHNPTRMPENLAHARLFVTSGDGTVDPALGSSSPQAAAGGGAVEVEIRQQNDAFVAALRAANIPVDSRPHAGIHDWPYWRSDLKAAIAHDLFAPVAQRPATWANSTVARHGELFGVRYRFASPAAGLVRFTRTGARLQVEGPAVPVALTTPGGCRLNGTLPLDVTLPSRRCARL
ncbi:MAG: diacylglycerol O-acyltransferase / trehalose O-mycolyltransferase, partial [Solirubrobacteraceae bacterium]|nr:diacylglycerol O-acyltransferase / trehalose O-mycolyltransferase [Solirubrobacteraceae bacterium]